MKILLVSYSGYGLWFTLRLQDEGHRVDYYLLDRKYENVLRGIAPEPFFKKPDFSKYDLVIFDLTGKPALAEQSIKVTPTLGDSNLATTLEDERLFGIEVMEKVSIKVPPYEVFSDVETAKKFLLETKKRYVFKPNGGQEQETASTYVSTSYEDMLKYIDRLEQMSHGVEFILQEVVNGVEVSTEAWFNGEEFFLINCTLEEKKFMEGRKGPNTGCSGNLVWTFEREPQIFKQGLGKIKDFLASSGYVGMIDLNTIATQSDLYGLEWTPRFGYDASQTLFSLIDSDLGEIFEAVASGGKPNISFNNDFAAAVRLSIPPYPSECEGYYQKEVPIENIEPEDIEHIYLYDAMLENDETLVTAGLGGFIACPIHAGRSIEEAFAGVKEWIKKIKVPDLQYRQDIYKCTKDRYEALSRMGWFRMSN